MGAMLSLLGYACFVLGLAAGQASPAGTAAVALPCLAKVLTIAGRAGLSAPVNALLTDGTSHEASRRRTGGLVGTLGLGYATGSSIGGYLSQVGNTVPCVIACGCASAAVACALLLPHPPAAAATSAATDKTGAEVLVQEAEGAGGWRKAVRAAVSDRVTVLLLALQFLRNVSFHVYGSTSKLYLCESLGYTPAQLGYILSFAG